MVRHDNCQINVPLCWEYWTLTLCCHSTLYASQFHSAPSFNQDLYWDTRMVTDMSKMFSAADAFDGDVSTLDVTNVADLEQMFQFAASFQAKNGLSNWNVARVVFYRYWH
jgi:Mycoplasma protein of unknown function, DUF285